MGPSDRAEPEFLNKLNPGPLMAGREPRREQRVKVPAPRTESWWNAIAPGGDRKSRGNGTDVDQQSAASAQRGTLRGTDPQQHTPGNGYRITKDVLQSPWQQGQSLKSFSGLRL